MSSTRKLTGATTGISDANWRQDTAHGRGPVGGARFVCTTAKHPVTSIGISIAAGGEHKIPQRPRNVSLL